MNVLFYIFLVLSIITGAISVFLTVAQILFSRQFTGRTKGTVAYWGFDEDMFALKIMLPVITFRVKDKEYKTNIPFSRVKMISDPAKYPGQFTSSGKLKNIYYYGEGNDKDQFYKKYRSGTEVDVFYIPDNPDCSYAVRPVTDPLLVAVWVITAFNIAVTLLANYLR